MGVFILEWGYKDQQLELFEAAQWQISKDQTLEENRIRRRKIIMCLSSAFTSDPETPPPPLLLISSLIPRRTAHELIDRSW